MPMPPVQRQYGWQLSSRYAISFGNHLSMLLLLVPFGVFVALVHPRRRELLRPQIVALAIAIACAAACVYVPGLLSVWRHIDAPASWSDRLATFWFDTTKADWREAMVF